MRRTARPGVVVTAGVVRRVGSVRAPVVAFPQCCHVATYLNGASSTCVPLQESVSTGMRAPGNSLGDCRSRMHGIYINPSIAGVANIIRQLRNPAIQAKNGIHSIARAGTAGGASDA
jgi:hypothetical protein